MTNFLKDMFDEIIASDTSEPAGTDNMTAILIQLKSNKKKGGFRIGDDGYTIWEADD